MGMKRNHWIYLGAGSVALLCGVALTALPGRESNNPPESNGLEETAEFKKIEAGDNALVEAFSQVGDEPQASVSASPEYRVAAQALHDRWSDDTAGQFLSLNEDTSFEAVSDALEDIFDRVDPKDSAFLLEALQLPRPEQLKLTEWQAIQRRIVDYLVDEGQEPDLIESELLVLAESADSSVFLKDAIVKRLDVVYERSQDPSRIAGLMWQLVELPNDDVASTSLASLARLSDVTQEIDSEYLKNVTIRLMESPQASVQTRVTAMEVANWMQLPEAYEVAVRVLKQDHQDELMQMIAISTLVDKGNQSDIPVLQKLQQQYEGETIGVAAKQAIELINGGNPI